MLWVFMGTSKNTSSVFHFTSSLCADTQGILRYGYLWVFNKFIFSSAPVHQFTIFAILAHLSPILMGIYGCFIVKNVFIIANFIM